MNTHPACDLFPSMTPEEYLKLLEDVTAHGVREPIVIHEGMILDGRHRHRAAKESGKPCPSREFDPSSDGESPVAWVISKNLHRRHLSQSQRAMIAVEVLPMFEAETKARESARKKGETTRANLPESSERPRDKAARTTGVSPRAVQTAKKVVKESPALAEQVKRGEKSLHAAAKEITKTAEPVTESTDVLGTDPVDTLIISLSDQANDIIKDVRACKKRIKEFCDTEAGVTIHLQSIERSLNECCEHLRLNKPTYRIVGEAAAQKGRDWCSQREYESLLPEHKEGAQKRA